MSIAEEHFRRLAATELGDDSLIDEFKAALEARDSTRAYYWGNQIVKRVAAICESLPMT